MAVLIQAVDRPLIFVAKRGFLGNPFVRLPLERLGTLFVERFDVLRGAGEADRFAAVLAQGHPLAFFPEGTFRDAPGLLAFRMGAFLAAAGAGVPLVPVALSGTRALMQGSSFFPRPGRADVVIGPPLQPSGSQWRDAVALRDAARSWISAHCGEPPLEAGDVSSESGAAG